MEMRVRISRLTCATALVVVIASCASPDERVDASPAAAESSRSSTSSASSVPAPQTSVSIPTTQAPTTRPRPAPTTAPAPKPPQPPPPEPPQPPPQPQPPAPPPPNPNPPPGTVSYDLPNDGSDLADEDNWQRGFEGKCADAGYPTDCLHMSVVVSAVGPDGKATEIKDPGPNYADSGVYSSCTVTHIEPEPPVEVPVGTTVVIEVLCQPVGAEGD
jgi:hypothetical protein